MSSYHEKVFQHSPQRSHGDHWILGVVYGMSRRDGGHYSRWQPFKGGE